MKRGNKKNKRGRGEGVAHGPAGDYHDHVEKIEFMMTSKSRKPQYHRHEQSSFTDGSSSVSCYNRNINLRNSSQSTYDICYEQKQKVTFGVFDFPWLKEEGEGVIFKGDDHDLYQPGMGLILEEEEDYTFAIYPFPSAALHPRHDHVNDFPSTTSLPMVNLHCPTTSPVLPPVLFQSKTFEDKYAGLSSFKVDSDNNIDDQQQTDCIWSSVLDQPLDINFNI